MKMKKQVEEKNQAAAAEFPALFPALGSVLETSRGRSGLLGPDVLAWEPRGEKKTKKQNVARTVHDTTFL